MKGIKRLLLILLLIIPFVNLNAASCQNADGSWKAGSVSLSTSSISLKTGKSTTFKVNGPCAAGKITITSSDTSIVTVNPSEDFLDNSSTTVTIKAKKAGKVTITVNLEDVGGYNDVKITGQKKLTVTVKDPTTTTKAPTKPTSSTKEKSTTKTTKKATVKTEPTTKKIKELEVSKFEIVGYDISFDKDVLEYSIDVAPNVDELYILVDGKDIKATGTKKVSIEGKDSVVVNLNNGSKSVNYKINIRRVEQTASVPEVKEVVKEVVKENNLYKYTSIILLVVCIILTFLLIKSKKNNNSNTSIVDDSNKTPLQSTNITNTSTNSSTPNNMINNQNDVVSPLQTITPSQNTVTPINPVNLNTVNTTNIQNNQIDNNIQ